MALVPYLTNPSRRRKLVAFGFRGRSLNPKARRTRKKKNPPVSVFFPSHKSTLFRVSRTGRWGKKKRHAFALRMKAARKAHAAKRRASPALDRSIHKGVTQMARHRKHHRRAKSHRRKNPIMLGANPRRSHRRSNPIRRHRGHYRSNPLKLGLPPMKEVLWLSLGAVGAQMGVPKIITLAAGALPIVGTNGYVRGATRVVIAAAASILARKVLKENAKPFIYGVLANQIPQAVNDIAAQAGFSLGLEEPENQLSMYTYSSPQLPNGAGRPMGMYTATPLGEEDVTVG